MIDPRTIGGSSAASCLGVGFESMTALWSRLRGDEARCKQWTREEQRRLDAGHALEPLVVQAVREDYAAMISTHRGILVHPQQPRIVGHVDGWIEPDVIGAEIKTVGHRGPEWGEPDTDQVPSNYLLQCMHYMMLSGAKEWHLFACRVPSWRVDRYIIRRDEALIDHLLTQELAMLALVDAGTPPDPADEEEARARWFAVTPGKQVAATPEILATLVRRAVATRAIKVCEELRSATALELLRFAEDADAILSDMGEGALPIATLSSSRAFDPLEFEARYPNLASECRSLDPKKARAHRAEYDSCMRTSGQRTIRLTKQFHTALKGMLVGEAALLPHIPEIAEIVQEAGDE